LLTIVYRSWRRRALVRFKISDQNILRAGGALDFAQETLPARVLMLV